MLYLIMDRFIKVNGKIINSMVMDCININIIIIIKDSFIIHINKEKEKLYSINSTQSIFNIKETFLKIK